MKGQGKKTVKLECQICGKPYKEREIEGLMRTFFPDCNCEADAYDKYQRKKEIFNLLIASGIEREHWLDDLSDFRWDEGYETAYKIYTNYLDNLHENILQGKGLMITGVKGTGKTRLTCYVLVQCVKRWQLRVLYVPVADLYGYFRDEEVRIKWIDMCKTVDILLLDDLGEAQIDPWNHIYLSQIINRRYERKKATFINSMVSLSQLNRREVVGEHLMSRLVHMNMSGMIQIKTDKDYRMSV